MAWKKLNTKKGNQGRGSSSYAMRLSAHADKKICVTIAEKLMRRLKWKLGDRVDFLIDQEVGLLGLRRTTDSGGMTITHTGKINGKVKTTHATVKLGMDENVLSRCVNGSAREFAIDELLIDDDEDIVSIELLKKGH